MYDNSDMSTLFQDSAGTTPVTAVGQPIGLQLDKKQGLVLGVERISSGAPAITGTATVATYNTSTGAGTCARVDAANQSWVQFSGLTVGTHRVAITNTGAVSLFVRAGVGINAVTYSVSPAASVTANFFATSGAFSVTCDVGSASFVVNSVKELAGTHRTQSTAASRPTFARLPVTGRRNLLTYTEQFDNAVWVKSGLNTTATPPYVNVAVSPDGTQNADFMVEDTANSQHNVRLSASMATSTAHTYSFYVKAAGRSSLTVNRFNSAVVPSFTHTFTLSGSGSSSGGAVTAVGNDWYRCSGSFTTVGAGVGGFIILLSDGSSTTYTGDGTSGIYLWGAQLELGSTATNYQAVTSIYDITETGVQTAYGLYYDGVDDFLVTPTITPGTDKVQVFAGVRKLSDATRAMVAGLGSGGPLGSFELFAPPATLNGLQFNSTGGTAVGSATVSGYAAPNTSVITGLGDISGDRATLRVNGTQVAQATTDQGAGNYNANIVYFGRRGGTTLPFNGYTFREIGRFGPNLDTATIANVENWINQNTGAY
jgi:hypothetical protein